MRASKNGSSKRPIATIGNKTSNIEEENEKDLTVDKENNDFKRASTRKAKSARNPKKDSNIETEEALENGLHTLPAKDEVDVIDDTNSTRAENDNKGGNFLKSDKILILKFISRVVRYKYWTIFLLIKYRCNQSSHRRFHVRPT